MDIYGLLPTIALLINVLVTVYIFAQKRRSRINKAYIYYSIILSLWIFCEIILRQNIPNDLILPAVKFSFIFWMLLGFAFLNFAYVFVDKKKNAIYYSVLILQIISGVLTLFTTFIIRGYQLYYWGPDEKTGIIFVLLIPVLYVAPIIYGLYLIKVKSSASDSNSIKKSTPLIIYGTFITFLGVFISNFLLPNIYDIKDTFQFAESITVVQSLFIFAAVYKYRLFGIGIEDISYNLFNSMKDGIIITDKTYKVIHINNSAKFLFGLSYTSVHYEDVNNLLSNISSIDDDTRRERKIILKDKEIIVLITKSRISQVDEHIGYIFYIKDITIRKNAEEELIEKESTLSELFESSPDVLIVVDAEGKIIQTNMQIEKCLGYNKTELIGKSINTLIPGKFREVHQVHISNYNEESIRREMGSGLDLFALKKDGTEIPVEVMLSPLTLDQKNMTLATVRDVTIRKLNEQKLKESERNYRSLILNHPHGIIENTFDGTIIMANKAYADIYEMNVDDMVGKKVWEVHTDPKFREKIKDFIEATKDGNTEPEQQIAQRKTKSGKEIEIKIDWNYKLDSVGEIIGYVTVVTDITKIRQIEKRSQKFRVMLSQAEKLANLGSWEWNMRSNELLWSDELFRIYGKTRNNFIPSFEKYQALVHPDDRERVIKTIANSIETGLPFFHFEKVLRPNGEIRILSTRGVVQKNKDDEIIGMYGSCLDVTEFKKIERELINSQKQLRALSANLQATREEERTRIAREIHDELGQVLTAINMDIGLMIDELYSNEDISKKTLLANLNSAGQLIEKLIKSVQDISTELRPDVLDHLGLIPALEWQLTEFEKRFQIKTNIKKNSDLDSLNLDDVKKVGIFRIFQETLTNVARHSKAENVHIYLSKRDGSFEVKVEDDGIGISDEALEDINSVGIIGIKERVLLLQGKISIKRGAEGGTQVHLTLPL